MKARRREPVSYQEITDAGLRRGKDFDVHVGNLANIARCLLVAPHGGGIEPGTTEMMRAVADIGGWAYYHFEGMLRKGNKRQLHITSTLFDEPEFAALLPQTDIVVSFHGAGGSSYRKVYVGGAHERGKAILIEVLNTELVHHDFLALDANDEKRAAGIRGMSPKNLSNRGRLGMGVQFEFSYKARRDCFEDLSRAGRQQPSPLLNVVAQSIHRALNELLR